jgi:hypothetical protein
VGALLNMLCLELQRGALMKKLLLTTSMSVLVLMGAAHAENYKYSAETIELGDGSRIMTCSGVLNANFTIDCDDRDGSGGYILDLGNLPRAPGKWIEEVCRYGSRCRVQAHVVESKTMDDAFMAIEVLHVTNKSKFSWE